MTAEFAAHQSLAVERWFDGKVAPAIDQVAAEVPVAMVYNGISHAVMLATPLDLEAFGLGFSLSEGILHSCGDIYDLGVVHGNAGIELQMRIAEERFVELKQRRRNLAGRTGCGLCGTESLEQVRRTVSRVSSQQRFVAEAIHRALMNLPAQQKIQSATGATHAAAWATPDGTIACMAEDIGRHNALDKMIGKLAVAGRPACEGFAIITSRASYEMVQKTAAVGIPLLAAVSAPTTFAVEQARESGQTLVGFTRNLSHVVYANAHRISESQQT